MSPRRLEHGTPEGYDRGCTVHAKCPAMPVHGLTCETAHIRFESGERRYMALYGRHMQAAAIARRLGFTPPAPTADAIAPADEYPIGAAVDVEAQIAAYAERKEARDRAAQTKEPTMTEPTPPVCPECAAGKHTNCDGTAWDTATDAPTTCTCTHPTHTPPVEPAAQPADTPAPDAEEPTMTEPDPTPAPVPKPPRSPKAASRAREQKAKAAVADPVKRAIVRAWARRAGYEVSDRGVIRQEVVYAYVDANGKTPPPARPDTDAVLAEASTARALEVDSAIAPDSVPALGSGTLALTDDVDIAHRSDFLDETRDRIGILLPHEIFPVAAISRPTWGEVATSADVEQARSIAVRLEQENALLAETVNVQGRSLEFTLRQWAAVKDAAELAERRRISLKRVLLHNLRGMRENEAAVLAQNVRLTGELEAANVRIAALTVQLEQAQDAAASAPAPRSLFARRTDRRAS